MVVMEASSMVKMLASHSVVASHAFWLHYNRILTPFGTVHRAAFRDLSLFINAFKCCNCNCLCRSSLVWLCNFMRYEMARINIVS